MKTKSFYTNFIIVSILALGFLCVSCDKDSSDVDMSYNRLFRPTSFVATADTTSVIVTWSSVPGASAYIFQLSKDSLLFENIIFHDSIVVSYPDTISGYKYTLKGLTPGTKYSTRVRVRAVSTNVLPSKYCQQYFMTTKK